jgi:lipoate-protein ligase A
MLYAENNSMDPYFNFALEYFLLKEIDLRNDFFLFWRTEPTLMVGKNQNTIEEINREYTEEKGIHVVRRISGGGTIYTDPNAWQFSFVIKNPKNDIDFYEYIAPILQALSELGIKASFNSRNDILVDGKKISGNAQYKDRVCMLHHGSILFDADLSALAKAVTPSNDKIISKGLKSVRERVANVSEYMADKMDAVEFKERMLSRLLRNMEGIYKVTAADKRRAEEIACEKFRTWEWNYGLSPKFRIAKSKRFAGGEVEFRFNVAGGCIEQCKIYGDFFCVGDAEVVSQALIGCPYRAEDINAALARVRAENLFYMISTDELIDCII